MRPALLVVLAACQHVGVTTQGTMLAHHVDELRGNGYAHVEVEQGGTVLVQADQHVSVVLAGNQESHLWGLVTTGTPDETRELTVSSFLAGCNHDGSGTDCLATRTHSPIAVGEQRRLDPGYFAMGLFGAIATTVGITCLVTCSNHSNWAWIGTGIGIITFAVPLGTIY